MIRKKGRTSPDDSYPTDLWITNMFPYAFDPCPFNPDWDESHYDGLVDEWDWSNGIVFINPPYSNVTPWILRAKEELMHRNMQGLRSLVVFLLKHDSSTKWYQLLHESGAHFLSIQGRLHYGRERPAAFPSVLAVMM